MNRNCDCSKAPCGRDHACEHTVNQAVEINTPVSIEPTVNVGEIITECARSEICRRTETKSNCNHKRTCEFVIKQTICVEIPISYDVETDVGESYVDCD